MTVTYEMEEKKTKTIGNPKSSDNTTTLIHQRSIKVPHYLAPVGGSVLSALYCGVHETFTEGEAALDRVVYFSGNRPMTQEEVEKFEQDWSNLWNPEAVLELD